MAAGRFMGHSVMGLAFFIADPGIPTNGSTLFLRVESASTSEDLWITDRFQPPRSFFASYFPSYNR